LKLREGPSYLTFLATFAYVLIGLGIPVSLMFSDPKYSITASDRDQAYSSGKSHSVRTCIVIQERLSGLPANPINTEVVSESRLVVSYPRYYAHTRFWLASMISVFPCIRVVCHCPYLVQYKTELLGFDPKHNQAFALLAL